jgi:hypothetical protein
LSFIFTYQIKLTLLSVVGVIILTISILVASFHMLAAVLQFLVHNNQAAWASRKYNNQPKNQRNRGRHLRLNYFPAWAMPLWQF